MAGRPWFCEYAQCPRYKPSFGCFIYHKYIMFRRRLIDRHAETERWNERAKEPGGREEIIQRCAEFG